MHIDDIQTTEELCKLSREELVEIEGTEPLVKSMDNIAKFTINLAKTLPYLSINYNWHIEPNIKLPILKQLFNNESEKSIDDMLIKYYKENTNIICNKLIKLSSKRENLLNETFEAHYNGKYFLSIIASFTIIDGIVEEYFQEGENFFQGNFYNNTLQKINNEKNTTIETLFLKSLFNDKLPVKLNKEKRKETEDFLQLNRHQVIHGETTNFNTELNSLKALSLLSSLSFNLKYLKDNYYK